MLKYNIVKVLNTMARKGGHDWMRLKTNQLSHTSLLSAQNIKQTNFKLGTFAQSH